MSKQNLVDALLFLTFLFLLLVVGAGYCVSSTEAGEAVEVTREEITGMGFPIWPGYRIGGITKERLRGKSLAQQRAEWENMARERLAAEEAAARAAVRLYGIPFMVLGGLLLVIGGYLTYRASDWADDVLALGIIALGLGGGLTMYPRQVVWLCGGAAGLILAYGLVNGWRRTHVLGKAKGVIRSLDAAKLKAPDAWTALKAVIVQSKGERAFVEQHQPKSKSK